VNDGKINTAASGRDAAGPAETGTRQFFNQINNFGGEQTFTSHDMEHNQLKRQHRALSEPVVFVIGGKLSY
jgi:hypothetical protein